VVDAVQKKVTPSPELRPSGVYALYEGHWLSSAGTLPGRPVLIRQFFEGSPPEGFEETETPHLYAARVPQQSVERLVRVVSYCDYASGGPFVVRSVSRGESPQVEVGYAGNDRDWASALPGLSIGDPSMSDGAIEGTIPLAEVSHPREEVEDLPLDR
jgi:hypothetical protein